MEEFLCLVGNFNDTSWENAYVQRDMSDSLNEFAAGARAAFGKEVIGITPTNKRFAQFNGGNYDGKAYINLDANVSFINIAGHELWHSLEQDRPDLHAWFAEQARAYYKNFDVYHDKLNALVGEMKPLTIQKQPRTN